VKLDQWPDKPEEIKRYLCDLWRCEYSDQGCVPRYYDWERRNPLVFRGILKSFVKSGDMEYGTDASNLDTLDFEQINSCLQYGHIMVVDDGAITN